MGIRPPLRPGERRALRGQLGQAAGILRDITSPPPSSCFEAQCVVCACACLPLFLSFPLSPSLLLHQCQRIYAETGNDRL